MKRRVLLADIGAAPLASVAKPQGGWVPVVYQRPALAAPSGLSATPTADAAMLTWIATPGAQTVIEIAGDLAGVPGSWSAYKTTSAMLEFLPLPAGSAQWVRLKAQRNGIVSAYTAAVLATPKVAAAQGDVDQIAIDVAQMRDDSILSPGEKPALIREYNAIVAERTGLLLLADGTAGDEMTDTQIAVAEAADDYAAAFDSLAVYFSTLTTPTRWDDTSGSTDLT